MQVCEQTNRTVRGETTPIKCAACKCAVGPYRPPTVAHFTRNAEVCNAQFHTLPHSYREQAELFDGNRKLLTHRKQRNTRTWRESVQATMEFYADRRRAGHPHPLSGPSPQGQNRGSSSAQFQSDMRSKTDATT
jgi:hypothetical protein